MSVSSQRAITFAVAVQKRDEVIENNFLASPCLAGRPDIQILVQENYRSAAEAYNAAIDEAANDLIVFAHHDMIFPAEWTSHLEEALSSLDATDPQWGVLGCYGETQAREGRGYVYSPGRGEIGKPFKQPTPVQTLDEIVLIIRKSSGLRFDSELPNFHLYGADICLRATDRGMTNYAVSAFCIHNAHQYCVLPKEFYESCTHLKRVWKKYLPIQTTCIKLTRFDGALYKRRLREACLRRMPSKSTVIPRVRDVASLLEEVNHRNGACERTTVGL